MRKVLLNATTIVMGGGIQAVVSFIQSAVSAGRDSDIAWRFIVSGAVGRQLSLLGVALDVNNVSVLEVSPARNAAARKAVLDCVLDNEIDAVFTFFGPAYVKFPVPHICGVADGWTTHADKDAYARIPGLIGRLKMFALCTYKGFWFRRADAWIVEEAAAKNGLSRRFFIEQDKVHVVSNNCGGHYRTYSGSALLSTERVRVLIFASYYPNKNIESVPKIISEFDKLGFDKDYEFVVTIDEQYYRQLQEIALPLKAAGRLRNLGKVDLADGPALYKSCDVLLMPSVLETFSAVYPEAMCMGVPIVTADKSFSRSICQDAALYYSTGDEKEAAVSIYNLLINPTLRESQVSLGLERLSAFPDAEQKYDLICDVISRYV